MDEKNDINNNINNNSSEPEQKKNIETNRRKNSSSDSLSSLPKNEIERKLESNIKKIHKDFDYKKFLKNLKNNPNNFIEIKKSHKKLLSELREKFDLINLHNKAYDINKAKNDLMSITDDLIRNHDNISKGKTEFYEIYYDLKKKREEKEKKIKIIEKIIDKEGIFKSNEIKLRNKFILGFICMILYLIFFID